MKKTKTYTLEPELLSNFLEAQEALSTINNYYNDEGIWFLTLAELNDSKSPSQITYFYYLEEFFSAARIDIEQRYWTNRKKRDPFPKKAPKHIDNEESEDDEESEDERRVIITFEHDEIFLDTEEHRGNFIFKDGEMNIRHWEALIEAGYIIVEEPSGIVQLQKLIEKHGVTGIYVKLINELSFNETLKPILLTIEEEMGSEDAIAYTGSFWDIINHSTKHSQKLLIHNIDAIVSKL